MKTMSSTSITSTNGVTLISLIGFGAPPAAAAARAARRSDGHRHRSVASLVDLARQDRRELVGEALKPLADLAGLA